jgi:hypothetical protein
VASLLPRIEEQAFQLPLHVTCIGRNGSMARGRYDEIPATGLDFTVVASHIEDERFPPPIHVPVVDQRGASHYAVLAAQEGPPAPA